MAISTLVLPFLSPIISAASAYLMIRITRAHAERKAGEGDEKTWRQARLEAEKSQKEALAAFERTYLLDKLDKERDLAAVTGILKEFAEMQRLFSSSATELRGMAGRVDRHDDLFDQLNDRIEAVNKHIFELSRNQAKP